MAAVQSALARNLVMIVVGAVSDMAETILEAVEVETTTEDAVVTIVAEETLSF